MSIQNISLQETAANELNQETLETVAGGQPFESSFGGSTLYRSGVSYANTVFGSDVYTIKNSQHQPVGISKDTAWNLREESEKLWKSKYADSADFIGYAREWKQILADKHGIDWDGSLGDYKFQLWD